MIHATAIVHPGAHLAADVEVGPGSVVGPQVEVGAGTWIGAHVVLDGRTRVGRNNRIFHFASIGRRRTRSTRGKTARSRSATATPSANT